MVGAYLANEWRVCHALQTDFLRNVDGYTTNVEAGALAGSVGVKIDAERQKEVQALSLRVQQMQLEYIYKRCGDDAGKRAAGHASEELQKAMMNFASMP